MGFTSVLCLFLLAGMICIFKKLNRIEKLLNDRPTPETEKKKTPEKPVQNHSVIYQEKPPVPSDPPPQQKIEMPPIQDLPEQTNTDESTLLKKFFTWLWRGNIKDKENVSEEYAVATTWLIRAGVIVLLCGIGFFLKYSIENNLISPTVRLGIAYLTGIVMFAAGTYLANKRFHQLAVGIQSIGIITLYMSSFAGFWIYKLLPAEAALGLMALTTAAAMIVSVRKDTLPAALTGCAGGYLTPVLLSTGRGNLLFLLCYTVIMSAGILIISRKRRWRSLEILSLLFSFVLIVIGLCELPQKITWLCLVCVFVNYLIFTLLPVIREKVLPTGKTEWLLAIIATAFALFCGVVIIAKEMELHQNYACGGYAVILAVIGMCAGILLKKLHPQRIQLYPAYLSASFSALATAVPLTWNNYGAFITGWSILGVIIAFASARNRSRVLLVFSGLIFTAAFLNAVMFFELNYKNFTDRLFSAGTFSLCLLAAGFILRKSELHHSGNGECTEYNHWETMQKIIFNTAGGLSFLWYSSFEVYYNLKISESLNYFRHGGLSVWWGILVAALIFFGIRKNLKVLRICGLILFIACLVKVYYLDISGLNTLGKVIAFTVLGILFLGAASAYIFFRKRFDEEKAEDLQEKEEH